MGSSERLKDAITKNNNHRYKGRDQGYVCVRLEATDLEMTAAIVREADKDIMDELPPQARTDYYLVESAEIIDAMTALEGG